ncbi:hypothetical protein B0H13DRAFT_1926726 [Mycena leptocephala]|nr:hypothetical protein B0H13DRAFT_1926726 [Mycena leptocephala]
MKQGSKLRQRYHLALRTQVEGQQTATYRSAVDVEEYPMRWRQPWRTVLREIISTYPCAYITVRSRQGYYPGGGYIRVAAHYGLQHVVGTSIVGQQNSAAAWILTQRMDRAINKGIRHRKLKGPLVRQVAITGFRAGDSRHRGWVRRTEICVDGTRVGGSFFGQNFVPGGSTRNEGQELTGSRGQVVSDVVLLEMSQRWKSPEESNNFIKAVAELLRIAAGDVEERHIKLRGCVRAQAWSSDGGTGARMLTGPGDPMEESVWAPGNANAAATHALGVAAGVSFERQGHVAQDTVAVGGKGRRPRERRGPLARHVVSAGGGSGRDFNVRCAVWSVWNRDAFKDGALQSDNRVGAGSNLEERGRMVKDNERSSGRGCGRSREKRRERRETHQNRAIPINPDPSQKGENSGPAIDAANRPHPNMEKNLNVEGQRERDRGEGRAGAQRSASMRRGKDVQRVRRKRREYRVTRGCLGSRPSLREKILSQGLALSSGGQGSGIVEGVVRRAVNRVSAARPERTRARALAKGDLGRTRAGGGVQPDSMEGDRAFEQRRWAFLSWWQRRVPFGRVAERPENNVGDLGGLYIESKFVSI